MKIAYLTTKYPHASHSFIRREIAALEARQIGISRFSIRQTQEELVDPADRAEKDRTTVILDAGILRLVLSAAIRTLTTPMKFFRTLGLAFKCGRRSERGVLVHFMYFVESCFLLDHLEKDAVDHLHAHFGINPAMVAMLCQSLGGPPYSFTVHGPDEFDRPALLNLAEKVARSRFTVAISHFTASQLYRWSSPQDWDKITIVRCGLDDLFLQQQPPPPVPNTPRFVCVGRLCEQKGQLLLVEAAAMLAREGLDFELALIGDGPMRGQIESAVRAQKLERHVSNQQVKQEILGSRAMVLPSFAEGLPVVLMEAMALGRPVISTYIAGIPELVEPGVNGWLVPAGSVQLLKQAMREALMAHPEKLTAMGAAGASRVLRAHDARAGAAKLAELFAASVARATVQVASQSPSPQTLNVVQKPIS